MAQRVRAERDKAAGRRALEAGERLWTVREVAAYLGVPVATLYQWRYLGQGPPSFRVGKHVRYDPVQLAAWLDALTAA